MSQMITQSDEGFVLPTTPASSQMTATGAPFIKSPTKRLNERLQEPLVPPESPDMKLARDRLGNLLTSIRKGDAPLVVMEKKEPEESDKRGPGRPRKTAVNYSKTKPGEVIFEMRGKPFSLREDRTSCTEYQLCRAWMRGSLKDDELPMLDEDDSPLPDDLPINILVGREITSLPRARSPYEVEKEWPDKETLDKFDASVDFTDPVNLKQEYRRHWRSIKKRMKEHTKLRAQRYHKSTDLLEAIYNAHQND